MEQFDIPVVLIMFKRCDTMLRIVERVKQVAPRKVYILGDAGRNEEEQKLVEKSRRVVEEAISWPCEVIKHYAKKNCGVHANIGLGAKWVFEREKWAIFLEDDNLPETTFFPYCKEMLEKYEKDTRILWVCGTNYLGKYKPTNNASYMFTQHLLPCGWASWSQKFLEFYDDTLSLAENTYVMDELKYSYPDTRLYFQQFERIDAELHRKQIGAKFGSWDYHMALSIRANHLLGISPVYNQIENIGVDSDSTHGGSSMSNIMTRRFCGMKSYPMEFPMTHPVTVMEDHDYEKKISNIILYPLQYRIKGSVIRIVKKILRISKYESLSKSIKNRKK